MPRYRVTLTTHVNTTVEIDVSRQFTDGQRALKPSSRELAAGVLAAVPKGW
ncbi:hypothetical protein ACFV1L_21210 [Kitasatospora sp. NPDC059646]|uniref:hypothetical protein n=1 Tax=Kitasatospora sp. NPDC059646 TaxID=3346893 RepID=UPI0036AF88F0